MAVVNVWRMRLDQVEAALDYRRRLQAALRAAGDDRAADYWERDIAVLSQRRADLVGWRGRPAARCREE